MRNNILEKCLDEMGIAYDDDKLFRLERYYELLIKKNEEMNLTAITDYDDVMRKHFADSLSVLRFHSFSEGSLVMDLGTGGGFPGIPLKIFRPDLSFLLMDSVNKKLEFVSEVIDDLGLKDIKVCHGRAEDLAKEKDFRERFDFVISRAVANLATLSELAMGFVKMDGYFISYKGSSGREELEAAGHAIEVMGGLFYKIDEYVLPGGDKRCLIAIQKKKRTPAAYPRKAGAPSRKPL